MIDYFKKFLWIRKLDEKNPKKKRKLLLEGLQLFKETEKYVSVLNYIYT